MLRSSSKRLANALATQAIHAPAQMHPVAAQCMSVCISMLSTVSLERPKHTNPSRRGSGRLALSWSALEKYAFLKGAIINEVGMLNCGGPTADDPICVPDSGKFPAKDVPDFGCPSNEDLPDGLATFISEIVELSASVTTSDGRPVVKSFSWFNIDRQGGTYNLRLFNDDGSINKVGDAYMRSCEKWGEMLL